MRLRHRGCVLKTVIVWGAPASGKTTYINDNRGENSIIYDFDKLMRDLSGLPIYEKNTDIIDYVVAVRSLLVEKLESDDKIDEAWFSATWVDDGFRNKFEALDPEYILIDISKDECLEQLENDSERDSTAEETKLIIDKWYDKYNTRGHIMEPERRFMDVKELRAVGDEMIIEGYPIVYEKETIVGSWFREKVSRGAAGPAFARSDEIVLYNHESSLPLARKSNGTLEVSEDDHGVKIRADLSKSNAGPGAYIDIKNGLITGMSFAFNVEREEWTDGGDGALDLRDIKEFKEIFDYSPVTYPQYKQTEIQARSADKLKESREAAAAAKQLSMDKGKFDPAVLEPYELELELLGVKHG